MNSKVNTRQSLRSPRKIYLFPEYVLATLKKGKCQAIPEEVLGYPYKETLGNPWGNTR